MARALLAYAEHRAAAERFAAATDLYETTHARIESDRTSREAEAVEREADRLARLEAAAGRQAEREEREAARTAHGMLREAIQSYALELRVAAVPVPGMIVLMKSAVRQAAREAEPIPEPEQLIADILEWSIAAYFAA